MRRPDASTSAVVCRATPVPTPSVGRGGQGSGPTPGVGTPATGSTGGGTTSRGGGSGVSSPVRPAVPAWSDAHACSASVSSTTIPIRAIRVTYLLSLAIAGPSRLRQQNLERRAVSRRRLHLDLAVVQLHGAIHHGEPDAAASVLCREAEVDDLVEMLGRN